MRSGSRIGIIMIFLLLGSFCKAGSEELSEEHVRVVMRTIGHQLLLASGDSTSRILPIVKVEENKYRIQFESEFDFEPDTLIKIVNTNIMASDLPLQYITEVTDCHDQEVVYSFEKGLSVTENACIGRSQGMNCYEVSILFTHMEATSDLNLYLIIAGLVVICGGLTFVLVKLRSRTKGDTGEGIALGKYIFEPDKARLRFESNKVKLTHKESNLLKLLVASMNSCVERDVLLKEVWGDEGSYVGRTLDVFISKLRKKLENDESIKITNVHGTGYQLETNA